MDAYVEEDTVYFATRDKIAFAKYSPLIKNRIESGCLQASQPLTSSKQRFTASLKRYHAAEHKVYNCFMQKTAKCSPHISKKELQNLIPKITEAKRSSSFSLFCGSTQAYLLIISMSLLIILNLFLNSILSIFLSLGLGILSIYFIQKNFFLEEPSEKELKLALRALSELLKGE
jgi:hypothetical protein